jgi:putative membrane protein
MLQFLLIALVAPPLLLLGTPAATLEGLRRHPRFFHVLEQATHPLVAFLLFNVAMTFSHWPGVVDALMPSQVGSFAIDITWLVIGLIFWWPVICAVPERTKFPMLMKIGYLALNGLLIRPVSLMLLYAKYPMYAAYELAPPLPGTSAIDDQQLAGVVMKVGSAWIMMVGVTVLFFIWHRRAHGAGPRQPE